MKSNQKISKQLQIDKTNASIVTIVSVAAVVIAFSLVSVKALMEQRSFQSRVISEQKASLDIAKKDITAVRELSQAYTVFDAKSPNIIGGQVSGTGPEDGSNSKLILNALPSEYDFPALVGSMEKFFTSRGLAIDSLAGTDDSAQNSAEASVSPVATAVPFQFSVTGNYAAIQEVVSALDKSILPIAFSIIEISGTEAETNLTVSANAYFQPAKNLNVTTKVVR